MSSRTVATKPLTQWLTVGGSWGALYGFCLPMLLFLAAPIAIVLIVSFSDAALVYFPPPGFSTRLYAALLDYGEFIEPFLLSVHLALLVTVLAVTLTVGHTITTLPYVVRDVIASLQSVRGNFGEASRVPGASAWQALDGTLE
jgi:ABC-type spermidine/putrescine transport system permease subunit II